MQFEHLIIIRGPIMILEHRLNVERMERNEKDGDMLNAQYQMDGLMVFPEECNSNNSPTFEQSTIHLPSS